MPKLISETEKSDIIAIIAQHPHGITTPEIASALVRPLNTRTLQRRLHNLLDEGEISASHTRPKRYFPVKKFTYSTEVTEIPVVAEDVLDGYKNLIIYSESARELNFLIDQPLGKKNPVSYQADFLRSYEPNVTYYLDKETREMLMRVGNAGFDHCPAGTYIRDVLDRLLIDLSWNSSRLEGNTYSVLETEKLLARGEAAEGKNDRETQMILNHKEAIELLADQASEIGFNPYTICSIHALLSDNLMSDPSACGTIRERAVGISGSVYLPLAVPDQIDEFFQLILEKAQCIKDPFEQAFFTMVHLPYLQPFEDVNKRVSRLSANIPLIRENLCPLSFIDVPQKDYVRGLLGVYELNRVDSLRDVFIWAYRRSAKQFSAIRRTLGEPDPFRLKHRTDIKSAVRNVILNQSDIKAPDKLSPSDAELFKSIINTELKSLHIGNIARYSIRPSEFKDWRR